MVSYRTAFCRFPDPGLGTAGEADSNDIPNSDKGHKREIFEFIDALIEDRPLPANEIDGARAMIMSFKTIDAFKTGLPQKISSDEYGFGIEN
jgi:hypothetical protein